MAGSLTQPQLDFLASYLGYDPSFELAASGAFTIREMIAEWRDAKDDADTQLSALAAEVQKKALPEAQDVARQVAAVLAPVRVKLVKPLMALEANPDDAGNQAAVLGAISETEAWLAADHRIAAVDHNPWNVPVTVVTTLTPALRKLRMTVKSAAKASA